MEESTASNTGSKGFSPVVLVVIIVLVALIGAGVMMANNNSTKTTAAKSEQTMEMSPMPSQTMKATGTMSETTTPATSEAMTDEQTIKMTAGSFYYNPKQITVKKGQKVKIEFSAVDMMHNFNIDELNVHGETTKSGDTTTIEFTADKVGSFEYYCSVANHRKMGQVGTLIVQ